MNRSDKISNSNQIEKLKSKIDNVFDDAEKELKELLVEAQKLAGSLRQQKRKSDKI